MPRPRSALAWQQGELGNLCSIYALANALRHCCEDGVLSHDEIRELIQIPLWLLNDEGLLLQTFNSGCGIRVFQDLLSITAEALAETYPMKLRWRRPFFRELNPMSKAGRLATMTEHLRGLRTTIICLLEHSQGFHWTVVSRISAQLIRVRDSSGRTQIPTGWVDFQRRRLKGPRYGLQPTGVFCLQLLTSEDA